MPPLTDLCADVVAEGHVGVQGVRGEELEVGELRAQDAGLQQVNTGHVGHVPHTPENQDRTVSSSSMLQLLTISAPWWAALCIRECCFLTACCPSYKVK